MATLLDHTLMDEDVPVPLILIRYDKTIPLYGIEPFDYAFVSFADGGTVLRNIVMSLHGKVLI